MCIILNLPSTFILHLHLTCDQGTTDVELGELFYLLNIVASCRVRKYFMHQHINFTDKSFISPASCEMRACLLKNRLLILMIFKWHSNAHS